MLKTRARPLPRWAMVLGSIAICWHLFMLLILVVAAPSGPWPTPFGPVLPADPPYFAADINNRTRKYFDFLQLTNNYHFTSNRMDTPSVYFEVRLKDKGGRELATVKYPQENANFWVRHRQSMLAKSLGEDQPVQASRTVKIPAPGKESPVVNVWKGEGTQKLEAVPEFELPKDRPAFRPSRWSLLLAQSYARYAGRTLGPKYDEAVSVELVRHSRNPIRPESMLAGQALPETFTDLVCSFGEYPIEK